MKKSLKSMQLHRETLHQLGDGALDRAVGGNWPKKDEKPSGASACVACTISCVPCL